MHIAFLGLGLIGGSVAGAASRAGYATRVTAWTPDGSGPRAAAADGIEVSASAGEAIFGADLIVLAAPPVACLTLLDDLAGPLAGDLAPGAVVTDVASTKALIVNRARARGLRFVGGHPMAGREASGYEAADSDLFRGRPWVIVAAEPSDAAADDRVAGLAAACGARPVRMSALDHDSAVAAVSHVPLVVSAALVEAMSRRTDWPVSSSLAAGGWASMTRLALGDPVMGAGIVATNARPIADALRDVQSILGEWVELIEAGTIDPLEVERRLAEARRRASSAGPAVAGGAGDADAPG